MRPLSRNCVYIIVFEELPDDVESAGLGRAIVLTILQSAQ
jgi:hypothetical protein